jgi:hypothetical protein
MCCVLCVVCCVLCVDVLRVMCCVLMCCVLMCCVLLLQANTLLWVTYLFCKYHKLAVPAMNSSDSPNKMKVATITTIILGCVSVGVLWKRGVTPMRVLAAFKARTF